MATPMHVYAELAARYGKVDPTDEEAVSQFFRKGVLALSDSEREAIGDELLARDGEPAKPRIGNKPRKYPKDVPAPKLGIPFTGPIVKN